MSKEIIVNPGERYGRLVVIQEDVRFIDSSGKSIRRMLCQCDCGTIKPVRLIQLRKGRATSCGCYHKETFNNFRHGMYHSDEHKAWISMKQRCYYPKHNRFKHYGGRGISVCQKWLDSFWDFFDDVGERPSPKHSLDRIDVNGNYEPGNVRWATPIEQANNTRSTKFIAINGISHTKAQWIRVYGIQSYTVYNRMKRGWSFEKALTTPVK